MRKIKSLISKMSKYLLLAVTVLIVTMTVDITSIADAGDFNSYDGGDSIDYSDVLPSYDYEDYGYDTGYDTGYDYTSDIIRSAGRNVRTVSDLAVYAVIVVVIIVLRKKFPGLFHRSSRRTSNKRRKDINISRDISREISREIINSINSNNDNNVNRFANKNSEIENKIREHDELFSIEEIVSYTKHAFVDYQRAWSKRDLEPIRGILDSELYDQTLSQVNTKIEDKVINKLERVAVTEAYAIDYKEEAENENIIIYLKAQMIDYQINEETGKIIAGDKERLWKNKYKLCIQRSKGMITPKENDEATGMNCPNCGAVLETSTFGKCEYCGAIVNMGRHGWVLSRIEKI